MRITFYNYTCKYIRYCFTRVGLQIHITVFEILMAQLYGINIFYKLQYKHKRMICTRAYIDYK